MKHLIYEYGDQLQVGRCRNYLDDDGVWKVESCHYDKTDKLIRMDERLDDDSYADIFSHELGHFIDDFMGDVSLNNNFSRAIMADFIRYNPDTVSGVYNLEVMLNKVKFSSAYHCHHFSDILSGIFNNHEKIVSTWEQNGDAFWGHEDAYWASYDGPDYAVEREVFADLFAIYAQNEIDTVRFVESAFPKLTQAFIALIGGENYEF